MGAKALEGRQYPKYNGQARPLTVFSIVIMLLSMSATVVSADVDISFQLIPHLQRRLQMRLQNTRYIVRNTGDDDAAVSLSTQQGNDCNGFTSTLETTFVQVGSQSSESVTLTVTVTEQASGECETTVNAQGQVSGGAPGTPFKCGCNRRHYCR